MSIEILQPFAQEFKLYSELRLQQNRSVSVSFLKGDCVGNVRNSSSGVSARVHKDNSWGFASTPHLDQANIRTALQEATTNAEFLASRRQQGPAALPSEPASDSRSFAGNKTRLTQRQLVEFIREVDAYVQQTYPDLVSRSIGLQGMEIEKTVLTADGAESYSLIPRTHVYVSLTANADDGKPVALYDVFGGLGHFEDQFQEPTGFVPRIDSLHEHLAKKQSGVFPDAGRKLCVLDSELAGILAHEAIGHTTEADLVLGGSIAGDYLDQEVANPLIHLTDFAHTYAGATCPMPVYVDDEGTRAEDVELIKAGVLKGYMHNKETAHRFDVAPTGNARASNYSDEPLIRMRNTAILPGNDRLEDMIAAVDDGYYLIRSGNGQADMTSEFMFGVVLGYEIKHGQIGRAIRDTTISGVAFQMLKEVTMVSDEMNWQSAGMCGKKQSIPTALGGPAVMCPVNLGGR